MLKSKLVQDILKDALVFGGKVIEGIELSLNVPIYKFLKFYSAFSYSNNKYIDFKREDWSEIFDYSGKF